MNELYIEKGGKKLRCGYTTGSCAAAASKAALIMLLDGNEVRNVKIVTPKGPEYVAEIEDITRDAEHHSVTCAVTKDGGDDPDATNGMKIYATVTVEPLGESVGTLQFDSLLSSE
nr:cobalt-precorrin-5B (C(1))-methyltransferase [Butyrivibrio sp.]